jgi:hypothetical protein
MNVQLRHQREFLASFWWPTDEFGGRNLISNAYQCHVQYTTVTGDAHDINTAAHRVLYMLEQEFSDTVFINQQHSDVVQALMAMGIDVTPLPGDPVDQMIGMMLYCKLSAVCAGRMTVDRVDVSSDRGGDVWYIHHGSEQLGPFASDGWWHQEDPWHCMRPDDADRSIIHPDPWREQDLAWQRDAEQESKIVYADFRKDAKQPPRPDHIQ